MSPQASPKERRVPLPTGQTARVWEQGKGEPLGFLGGLCGLPRWLPFLERLAERRRVIAPSLPGCLGSDADAPEDLVDWICAGLDLLDASGLSGADLIGASLGASLAAEIAALSHATVRRLVLMAPLGLGPDTPTANEVFASPLATRLSCHPERFEACFAPPAGADPEAWQAELSRTRTTAMRFLGATGDRGLGNRLHRIEHPTLLVWGEADQVVPVSCAKQLVRGLSGLVQMRGVAGAGHMVELDAPDASADAILRFLN